MPENRKKSNKGAKIKCKKCGRDFRENRDVTSFSLDGEKVEFEYYDLCPKCFKKEMHLLRKTGYMTILYQKGVIDDQFVRDYVEGKIPEARLSKLISDNKRDLNI